MINNFVFIIFVLGISKGYGFVSFDSFESSDFAIECMNGQYLCNRPIVVQYAYKKDTPGERHGSQAERLLAASQPKTRPHTIFSGGHGDTTVQLGTPAVNMTTLSMGINMAAGAAPPPPMDPQLLYQMQMSQYAQQMQYSTGYMMPNGAHPSMYGQPMQPMPPQAMYGQYGATSAPPPPPQVPSAYPAPPNMASYAMPPPPPPPPM